MPNSFPTSLLVNLLSLSPDWPKLTSSSSWELIKSASRTQGLAPLVAFTARNHVPTAERAWCDEILTRSWRRHDASMQQLGEVVSLFIAAGIESIALKGPVLAQRSYAPSFLRKPSGDLDLAVRPADMGSAIRVLENAGYSLLTSLREATATSHHTVLRHKDRITLELHFRLSHGILGIPVGGFFDRALPYQIPSGPQVLVLNPADELMHLALHLVNDRFATLFHSYEVRRLWKSATADMQTQVIRKATDFHFVGVLALCDIAVKSIWGESLLPSDRKIPETWLQWRINERLFLQMAETAGCGLEQPLGVRLRGRLLDLQTTDRPTDALRRIASLAQVTLGQIRRKNWSTGRIPVVNSHYAPRQKSNTAGWRSTE